MMKIEEFSKKYLVRILNEKDIPIIYNLCCGNPIYYEFCPPFVTQTSILEDMVVLPPGKDKKDKYYVGFFDSDKLIAVMDFIDGYPEKNIAFIGFFMTDTSIQGKGISTEIISELCKYLRQLHYESVRLAYVKGNEQSKGFWHKNNFVENGIETKNENYTAVITQRML